MADKRSLYLRIAAAAAFAVMVAVNALANIIPINGMTTGQVSAMYENLFTPAAFTFSIWGVIYLLLFLYVLYSLGLFRKKGCACDYSVFDAVSPYFILSSIANILWIFAWHYLEIPLSAFFTALMLVCLICINRVVISLPLPPRGALFIRIPFGLYFGWLTAALIANITVMLVYLGWNGFGLSDAFWTVAVLLIGFAIAVPTALKIACPAYALAVFWAYAGIFIKHVSPAGYAGEYTAVVVTSAVLSVLLLALAVFIYIRPQKRPA